MSNAIATVDQRCLNARDFYKQANKVLAMGKNSPWLVDGEPLYTDDNPPSPSGHETEVEEPIAYKRINEQWMAKRDDEGSLEYREELYSLTQDLEVATADRYNLVYITGTFEYDEVPLKTYRQVGLYSLGNLVFDEDNISLPTGDEDPGILSIIDFRRPQPREWDQTETFSMMIKF